MFRKSLWILVALLAVSVFILTSCQQQAKTGGQELKAAPKASVSGKAAEPGAAKTCPMKSKKPCAEKKATCTKAAEKPCAKMTCAIGDGKAANKDIYSYYKGKKYYFCCENCKKEFEKDPEKCIGKCKDMKK